MLCSLYSMSPNQGGFKGDQGGPGHHFFFEIQNCFFYRILSKINKGNCPGYSFLNFMDPPLLMCAITCDGKSTTPLNCLALELIRA